MLVDSRIAHRVSSLCKAESASAQSNVSPLQMSCSRQKHGPRAERQASHGFTDGCSNQPVASCSRLQGAQLSQEWSEKCINLWFTSAAGRQLAEAGPQGTPPSNAALHNDCSDQPIPPCSWLHSVWLPRD